MTQLKTGTTDDPEPRSRITASRFVHILRRRAAPNRDMIPSRIARPALAAEFFGFVVLCAILTVCATSARCADLTIPYAKLYPMFSRGAQIKSPHVRPIFVVQSTDKAVKPGSITLTVQAKSGAIPLKIDPDGEIHGFPVSAELLKEDPPILTNQAKGSLRIGGGIGITLPDSLTFSFAELNGYLVEASAEMKKQAGMFLSFMVPSAKGLIFEFASARKQTLTIAYKAGPKVLTTDSDGGIKLPIDKTSLAANPTVTLSEKPLKVSVDL